MRIIDVPVSQAMSCIMRLGERRETLIERAPGVLCLASRFYPASSDPMKSRLPISTPQCRRIA